MERPALILLLFVALCGNVFAAEISELLQAGNEAYRSNNYSEAIDSYEKVITEGYYSADLYYNLGNAYYRSDRIGKAILNYERAHLIRPRDEDIKYNLRLANSQLQDEIEAIPEFFLSRWWNGLSLFFSSGGWSVLALLLFWAGIAGLILWLTAPLRKRKKQGFILGVILLIVSMLPFALAYNRMTLEKSSSNGVITKQEVILRSGPDAGSAEVLKLHEGTKVQMIDFVEGWHKIRLQNGELGWLPTEGFERI